MAINARFYGQFDPPLDKVLFEQYFSERTQPGFYIECGAFDGITESSCKFFEESMGWGGINIEASPPIYSQLQKNRPRSLNLHCALGDRDGDVPFTHVIHPVHGRNFGNGSIRHFDTHRQSLLEAGCTFEEYQGIPMITFRHLMTMLGIRNGIDLMVLDVEGAELDVIAGMHGSPVLPRILCAEVGHLGLAALEAALKPLGYRYDGESFVNAFFILDSSG